MADDEQFWLVWNEAGHAPTFKHKHPESAEKEAERLARLYPGQSFHVLALSGTVEVNPVAWKRYDTSEIPF